MGSHHRISRPEPATGNPTAVTDTPRTVSCKWRALQQVARRARSITHPVLSARRTSTVIGDPGVRTAANPSRECLRHWIGGWVRIIQLGPGTAAIGEGALQPGRVLPHFLCLLLKSAQRDLRKIPIATSVPAVMRVVAAYHTRRSGPAKHVPCGPPCRKAAMATLAFARP